MKELETARFAREKRELIGRNVASLRKAQKLTQTRLGAMARVSRQELAKIESGKANATINTFIKLADSLDVELADLLGE